MMVAIVTGRKNTTWKKVRPILTVKSRAAATSEIAMGAVTKIVVKIKLFDTAFQKRGSANSDWKFPSPMKCGALRPFQSVSDRNRVAATGKAMTEKLRRSAGRTNSQEESLWLSSRDVTAG